MTIGPFSSQLAFDHHLGGDTGMISSNLPQGVGTLHALIADQQVHDGVLKRMAHVQVTGDIWRRDHNAVGVTVATGDEIAILLPALIPALLYVDRVVMFIHFGIYLS